MGESEQNRTEHKLLKVEAYLIYLFGFVYKFWLSFIMIFYLF